MDKNTILRSIRQLIICKYLVKKIAAFSLEISETRLVYYKLLIEIA